MALVNHYYLARIAGQGSRLSRSALAWANQATTGTHVNVSGAGVTAHAKNRANAIKFLDFLSTAEAQQMFADLSLRIPGEPAGHGEQDRRRWGPFKRDDVNVASAGEFQAAAVRLADRAGYK